MEELERFTRRLGHRFADGELLALACRHRSVGAANNERLEFLGDAALNLIIAEALYARRPRADEGDLSRLRAALVREETLAVLARELDLGAILELGAGELRSGGFRRDSILADALEAIIGALYLDAGLATTRDVCLRLYAAHLENLPDASTLKDAKTRLQEALQARGRPLPEYRVLDESGPPHCRSFQVRCALTDDDTATEATGRSRKQAEQDAAALMLAALEQTHA